MSIKLVKPRLGKSKNYRIRGTYLEKRVNQSTGVADEATAKRVFAAVKKEIERGRFAERKGPTFAEAFVRYVEATDERRFLAPLLAHFRETPLAAIGQAEIDEAAAKLYGSATPATRNRQVYTPMSAILKHAGVTTMIRRPKGSQGQQRTQWLWPEDAEKLIAAATEVDREFGAFIVTLLYTGLRLSEGLALECRNIRLEEGLAYVPTTKNGEPRSIHLTPFVAAALGSHPSGLRRDARVFRFTKSAFLYRLLDRAKSRMDGDFDWLGFHSLRHTWATWMRRYGGLDTRGLVGTGAWKDAKSAQRYEHVLVTEEARKADLLPTPKIRSAG